MFKTIRTKIVLTLFVLLTATMIAQSLRLYFAEKALTYQQAEIFRTKVTQDWAVSCQQNYIAKLNTVNIAFRQSHPSPTLVSAACYDEDGAVFSALTAERLQSPVSPHEYENVKDAFPDGRVLPARHAQRDSDIIISEMPVNVFSDRKILARVYLSKSRETDGIKQKLRASAARIYAVSALSLCAAYIAMLLISIIFIKPIDEITKGAREIGSGNLAYRIKLKRNDELGQMGTELNEMAEKLSELEKIKEDFTSAITHDLRSPVTAIKLAAGNITKEYINGKHIRIPEQVFSIEENAERLNRLIDSILKVAKIESGKDTMSVKPVNIEDTLANIIDGNRPYAKSKNISLDLIVENTIADITADPEKLEQAFSNIIINSLKFTKEGFVNVYIRSDNGAQEVRIADSGHGIANRDLKHIFEKFYKGKNSEKGLGLGLYITKKIVDMHGGTMEVKSVLGKGTEFTVRLPSNGGSAAKKQGIAS